MKKKYSLIIIIVLFFNLDGCAPSVSFSGRSNQAYYNVKDYELIYIWRGDRLSDNLDELGEISVYDAGLAVNCDYDDVMIKIEEEAKRIGADAIKLTEIQPPDVWSTCYRIKALAYAYNGEDSTQITYENILAPMDVLDSAFISFTDCIECLEYGDSIVKSDYGNEIIFIPFSGFISIIDAGENYKRYPLTESRIDEHLKLLLDSYGMKVNILNINEDYYESFSNYYNELVENLLYNYGNPLNWNLKNSISVKNNNKLFYIPIGIERKAQQEIRARFYSVIVNGAGKIISLYCLNYDNELWERNFNKFANDIENKLPLMREE